MKRGGLVAFGIAMGIGMVALPEAAQAQGFFTIPNDPDRINMNDIVRILVQLIQVGMIFAAGIAVISIVVNGYQYILSAGNPEKVEKAKQGLTWSITGFILAISSYAIVLLLQETLKSKERVSDAPGIGGALRSAPTDAEKVLINLADVFLAFAAATAVLFLILGGYRYVTSQGNRDLVEAARRNVLYSVIGLAVSMLAYVIVVTVIKALK